MKSVMRLTGLAILAVPVFTGLALFPESRPALPGVAWLSFGYAFLVLIGIGALCGRALLANALAVTVLILAPVIYGGATVSWLLTVLGGTSPEAAGAMHGAHYVRLTLNMLSVIPLALALVASIPFDRLELRLLRTERGIASGEKYLLMFIRVFHHTVYFVIPNILEVMREETLLRMAAEKPGHRSGLHRFQIVGRRLTAGLVQIGISSICAALRFIPLWAREIDDLPRRTPQHHRSQT